MIREKERTRIFERFYRGEEARRLAPGTSPGLYFACKIAEAHGGSKVLEEEAYRPFHRELVLWNRNLMPSVAASNSWLQPAFTRFI